MSARSALNFVLKLSHACVVRSMDHDIVEEPGAGNGIGLDLLINPKKKMSRDAMSNISSDSNKERNIIVEPPRLDNIHKAGSVASSGGGGKKKGSYFEDDDGAASAKASDVMSRHSGRSNRSRMSNVHRRVQQHSSRRAHGGGARSERGSPSEYGSNVFGLPRRYGGAEDDDGDHHDADGSYAEEEERSGWGGGGGMGSKASHRGHPAPRSQGSERSGYSAPRTSSALSKQFRPRTRYMTEEETIIAKQDLLAQFDRLESKGYHLPRQYTMSTPLEDMKAEMERIKKVRALDSSVQFQRNILITCVTGLEYLNEQFDPLDVRLSGWSANVNDSMMDYDEVFEELHEMYGGKTKMDPKVKLMFMLGGSAVMQHMNNKMSSVEQDGGYAGRKNSTQQPARRRGGGGGGLMGMLGGLGSMFGFGGGGSGGGRDDDFSDDSPASAPAPARTGAAHTQQSAPPPQREMRGPSNVDDLLKDLQRNAFQPDDSERIEVVSNAGTEESDIEELRDEGGGRNRLDGLFGDSNGVEKDKAEQQQQQQMAQTQQATATATGTNNNGVKAPARGRGAAAGRAGGGRGRKTLTV